MNKWGYRLVTCLCMLGIGIQLYPFVKQYAARQAMQAEIASFNEKKDSLQTDALYEEMKVYNETIYKQKQSGLVDAFSYSQNPFTFTQFKDHRIGYVKIDKLGLKVPLYMGASYENLNKGVAVLSQTSAPIGGENTNCVIAGHRGGTNGEQLFKHIEKLEKGDEIEVINPWETLRYVVTHKIVIEPHDIEAIKIIPKQDMVTLFSCHPYAINSHRYVVYAQRKGQQKEIEYPEGIEYESSTKEIEKEESIQKIALFVSVLLSVVLILCKRKTK